MIGRNVRYGWTDSIASDGMSYFESGKAGVEWRHRLGQMFVKRDF